MLHYPWRRPLTADCLHQPPQRVTITLAIYNDVGIADANNTDGTHARTNSMCNPPPFSPNPKSFKSSQSQNTSAAFILKLDNTVHHFTFRDLDKEVKPENEGTVIMATNKSYDLVFLN